jgi:hypothetical protein
MLDVLVLDPQKWFEVNLSSIVEGCFSFLARDSFLFLRKQLDECKQ